MMGAWNIEVTEAGGGFTAVASTENAVYRCDGSNLVEALAKLGRRIEVVEELERAGSRTIFFPIETKGVIKTTVNPHLDRMTMTYEGWEIEIYPDSQTNIGYNFQVKKLMSDGEKLWHEVPAPSTYRSRTLDDVIKAAEHWVETEGRAIEKRVANHKRCVAADAFVKTEAGSKISVRVEELLPYHLFIVFCNDKRAGTVERDDDDPESGGRWVAKTEGPDVKVEIGRTTVHQTAINLVVMAFLERANF